MCSIIAIQIRMSVLWNLIVLFLNELWVPDSSPSSHHLSLNREGRYGTTDDFTTSFLHFLCSPLPSGTWRTPGLSIPRCCLSTYFVSLSLCLVKTLGVHLQGSIFRERFQGKWSEKRASLSGSQVVFHQVVWHTSALFCNSDFWYSFCF